jgi:hypothetical protein
MISAGPYITFENFERVVIQGLNTKTIRDCALYDQHGKRMLVPMHFEGDRLHIAGNGLPKGIYCVCFRGTKNFYRIFIVPT